MRQRRRLEESLAMALIWVAEWMISRLILIWHAKAKP